MLFLPLLDRSWRVPALPGSRLHYLAWGALLLASIALLVLQPSAAPFAVATLLMAALPEEWFFRAYFMQRIGAGWRANLVTSLLFSLMHGLSRDGMTALSVFAPSLFYGWLFQRSRDLPLVILVHALSNLVFMLYLARHVAEFWGK
jgi:membrane protease YdiL (CAAX protease family)